MKLSTTTEMKKGIGDKEAITILANAGFDCYDLNLCTLHLEPEHPLNGEDYMEYLKELKALAEQLGITCNQAHAPFPSQINQNDEYNEMAFNSIVRSMECASYLGAKIIVVHPIKERKDGLGKVSEKYPSPAMKNSEERFLINMEFYRKLLPYCEKYQIKVALENMWIRNQNYRESILPSVCGTAEEFVKYLDTLDSKWFVACLDLGHCILAGENPQDAIRVLGKERLQALHVHDVNYREDSHTIPYTMKIQWDEVLKALKEIGYEGDFTFEAVNFFKGFPEELIPDAASLLCKVGRHMMEKLG